MAESKAGEKTALVPVRLPYPEEAAQYGYSREVWRVLTEAIFPNAQSQHSVVLALAYCKARGLDVLKRPVHIVPIWDKKRSAYVETIWPGIGELRTTASRTKQYAGKDKTVWGPTVTETLGGVSVSFPQWAEITVYKVVDGIRCPFEGPRVYWKESYATQSHDSEAPNTMWKDRPNGQLEKCAEAAALRLAFPEEIGNDYAAEEMEGRKFESLGKTAEGHELLRPKRKSDAAKESSASPAADPGATAPAEEAPAESNPYIGAIRTSSIKKRGTSKKDGKDTPYTIYSIVAEDGRIFETFSDTHFELAQASESGSGDVEIYWKRDAYGLKVEKMSPVTSSEREPGSEG